MEKRKQKLKTGKDHGRETMFKTDSALTEEVKLIGVFQLGHITQASIRKRQKEKLSYVRMQRLSRIFAF